jgi:hypothetical protein
MTAARKLPAPDFAEPPARDYAAEREAIALPCGRIVERMKQAARQHLYRLWEPVLAGSRYAIERVAKSGGRWGLAHTRRPPDDRPRSFDEQIEHQLAEQRRTMDLMRARVQELGLRNSQGRPGGIAQALYEARGDLLLFSDPEVCAGLAVARRTGARRT